METLCILLPTLNEAESIEEVITDCQELGYINEVKPFIVVADSGSTDGTVEKANKLGARVFNCPKGKAEAFNFVKPFLSTFDYVIMLDSDGTYPPRYIPELAFHLSLSRVDVVVGLRRLVEGSMSFTNIIGNQILTITSNLLFPTDCPIPDLCTGYWGLSRRALSTFSLEGSRFELEANLFTETYRNRWKLGYIDILYYPRKGTKPKLKIRDGFMIMRRLLIERWRIWHEGRNNSSY